jgi:hypothetical protein
MFVLSQIQMKINMYKKILLSAFCVIYFLSGQSQSTHSLAPKLEDIGNIANFEKGRFHRHTGMQLRDLSEGSDYNVTHYNCEWQVDPAINYVAGKVTTTFLTTVEGLDSVQFDLHSDLTVDSVIYHGQSIAFSHTADVITIPVDPISINTIDSVSVIYQGVPPSTGLAHLYKAITTALQLSGRFLNPMAQVNGGPAKTDSQTKLIL